MTPPFDLNAFLPYRLNRAAEQVSQDFARSYKQHYGMTRPDWRCLATIGQHGRVTATEIAVDSTLHKTKVSRAISRLENRNWVTRRPDETDRRIEHIQLTPEGQHVYTELAKQALAYQAALIQSLGSAGPALDEGLTALSHLSATP